MNNSIFNTSIQCKNCGNEIYNNFRRGPDFYISFKCNKCGKENLLQDSALINFIRYLSIGLHIIFAITFIEPILFKFFSIPNKLTLMISFLFVLPTTICIHLFITNYAIKHKNIITQNSKQWAITESLIKTKGIKGFALNLILVIVLSSIFAAILYVSGTNT